MNRENFIDDRPQIRALKQSEYSPILTHLLLALSARNHKVAAL